MRWRVLRWANLGGLLAVVATGHPIQAQPVQAQGAATPATDERLEALYSEGVLLREQGRDEEALAKFEEARRLSPTARALVQVGLAEVALGRWVDAYRHLRAALATEGDEWLEGRRGAIESELERVGGRIGELSVEGNVEGARVLIDGRELGQLPLDGPLLLLAGQVTLEVQAPGHYPITRIVPLEPRTRARERVELRPREVPAPSGGPTTRQPAGSTEAGTAPAPAPASRTQLRSRYWGLGVGLVVASSAMLVASLVLYRIRESRAEENNECVDSVLTPPAMGEMLTLYRPQDCVALREEVRNLERPAYVLLGLGLATGVAGALLMTLPGPRERSDRALRCAPAMGLGPRGAMEGGFRCGARF